MTSTPQTARGIRQAAIVISQLDAETADLLLSQLPDSESEAIRRAVMVLDEVDADEEEQALTAFHQAHRAETTSSTSSVASDLPPLVTEESGDATEFSDRPFEFLETTHPGSLSRLLYREHPQTVAVVLAHLPVDMAADVIRNWPHERQADVLTRMAHLDEMHPDALASLEQAVYAQLAGSPRPRRRGVAGVAVVESIVHQLVDKGTSPSLMRHLAKRDRELAHVLNTVPPETSDPLSARPPSSPLPRSPEPLRTPVDFADLESLSTHSWAKLLQAVDSSTMLLALAGAPAGLLEALERLAPPSLARGLHKRLAKLGPLALEDVDRAQQQVSDIVARLIESGEIPPVEPKHFAAAI